MNTADATARMKLHLLAEPGDPAMAELVRDQGVHRALELALSRNRGIPARILDRVASLDSELSRVSAIAHRCQLRWITPSHPEWPAQLEHLDHLEPIQQVTGCPLGLWVRGAGRFDPTRAVVAIVGARSCTTYGSQVALEVAAQVAAAGGAVVSGAAFGIDAAAHRGALLAAQPTIAVLASGADIDSPASHASLLAQVARDGVIVSEQQPGARAAKHRFLSRNRLIAALATATVVIEAAERSGSLNTLHWSDQLGRQTFAVPGPISSVQSAGTNRSIRDGKAQLLSCADDVLEVIQRR